MMEPEMRATTAILAGLVALMTVSAQAAPPAPAKALPAREGAAPPIELVAQGCGPGWHRHGWRDYWGRWHWGRCVPNW
jgi:Spy/CpxP family protein refolding chaperone